MSSSSIIGSIIFFDGGGFVTTGISADTPEGEETGFTIVRCGSFGGLGGEVRFVGMGASGGLGRVG